MQTRQVKTGCFVGLSEGMKGGDASKLHPWGQA